MLFYILACLYLRMSSEKCTLIMKQTEILKKLSNRRDDDEFLLKIDSLDLHILTLHDLKIHSLELQGLELHCLEQQSFELHGIKLHSLVLREVKYTAKSYLVSRNDIQLQTKQPQNTLPRDCGTNDSWLQLIVQVRYQDNGQGSLEKSKTIVQSIVF